MEHQCWSDGNLWCGITHMQPASLFHIVLLSHSGINGSLQMCSKILQILSIRKISVSLFQNFVWASARNPQRGIPEHSLTITASQSQEFLLMVYIWYDKRDFSHHLCSTRSWSLGPSAGTGSERLLSDQGDKWCPFEVTFTFKALWTTIFDPCYLEVIYPSCTQSCSLVHYPL